MELKDQLTALQAELKTHFDKAAAEQKSTGTMLEETKSTIVKLQTQVDAMDVKLAQRHIAETAQGPSLVKTFSEDEGIRKILKDKKGHVVVQLKGTQIAELMERKNIISAVTSGTANGDPLAPVGVATTGVLPIDRVQTGIVAEARQRLTIRNLFSSSPTSMQVVDYVKVVTPLSIASPVPEASVKPENQLTFAAASERVKLLATWIPATRQVLDDFQELMAFIKQSLPYYVNLEEELQILAGDNTGENLHGIIPQSVSFNSTYLPPASGGYNRMDIIGAAINQINSAKEIDPTFVVINPIDWWKIRFTKTTFGQYILGDPQQTVRPNIFGLDVAVTTSMAPGTFLVGSGNPVAAEIKDRMEMEVEISSEHADYFTRNLLAIRAEKRLAFLCKRPNSFVAGTFVTSP